MREKEQPLRSTPGPLQWEITLKSCQISVDWQNGTYYYYMKHIVEIELGLVEVTTARYSYVDQYGDVRSGKQEKVEFLTSKGELQQFDSWEEWINTLPSNVKFYRIGHVDNNKIGLRGCRFETIDTRKVTMVL